MKRTKKQRQADLQSLIETSPFIRDEELARRFGVSVQTIRLDRMELSIPEMRERIKSVAEQQYDDKLRALHEEEVIGQIVDLELDNKAISILDIRSEHVFERSGITRGHHLFAQANSLAVAVIDDELALTERAEISFTKPVKAGDRVVAKAAVKAAHAPRTTVTISSYVELDLVFKGHFTMYRSKERMSDNP